MSAHMHVYTHTHVYKNVYCDVYVYIHVHTVAAMTRRDTSLCLCYMSTRQAKIASDLFGKAVTVKSGAHILELPDALVKYPL